MKEIKEEFEKFSNEVLGLIRDEYYCSTILAAWDLVHLTSSYNVSTMEAWIDLSTIIETADLESALSHLEETKEKDELKALRKEIHRISEKYISNIIKFHSWQPKFASIIGAKNAQERVASYLELSTVTLRAINALLEHIEKGMEI